MRLRRRHPQPVDKLGDFELWPRKARRSLNPFPAIGRAIKSLTLGIVHESTFTAYVAAVAMVISYGGLKAFAEHQNLPLPWLWPISIDLAAVAVARMARKMQRLGVEASDMRRVALGLVVLSVGLQISTVNVTIPPYPLRETSTMQTGAWLFAVVWAVVPAVIGHGAPAATAFVLDGLGQLLQRTEKPVETKKARARRKPEVTESERPTQQTPEAGQRRPTPSELEAAGRESQEGSTASPPGSGSDELTDAELALADQVDAMLRELDVAPTKETVRPIVLENRGSASTGLVLKINREIKRRRTVPVTS